MDKRQLILIILGLILIFPLYLYNLGDPELGFWTDEASIGFNAYCISQNLHDYNNNLLPFYFNYQNGFLYRPSVYIYITAIIIKIFGLSVFTTKILAVCCAIIAVLMLFLIGQKLFNSTVGFFAALFMAFSPGYFHIHRFAYELTTFTCFFLIFVYFLLLSVEKKSFKLSLIAIMGFILSWYSYIPARLFLLASIFLCLLSYKNKIFDYLKTNSKQLNKPAIAYILLLLITILIPEIINFPVYSTAEYTLNCMLFNKPEQFINEIILDEIPWAYQYLLTLPLIVKKLLFALRNYLMSYSPGFLFLNGDEHILNLVPGYGFFPLIGLLLVPIGVIKTIFNLKTYTYRCLFLFFITIGLPPALIWVNPDGTHNSQMYAIISLLAGIGAWVIITVISSFNKKYLNYVVVSILLFGSVCTFINYFLAYNNSYKKNYQQAFLANRYKIYDYIKQNHFRYDHIYISNQIPFIDEHLLFFGVTRDNYNPLLFQQNKILPYNVKLINIDNSSKYSNIINLQSYYGKNILIIVNNGELKSHYDSTTKILRYNNNNILAILLHFK